MDHQEQAIREFRKFIFINIRNRLIHPIRVPNYPPAGTLIKRIKLIPADLFLP
jgi:hypothetical protein